MSVYAENEVNCDVFHPSDSDTTKITTYSSTKAFTIKMNIIRRNEDYVQLAGAEMGDYVANVNDTYTNVENIARGDKVVDASSVEYIVVNDPKHLKIVDKYKVLLRKQN